MSGPKGEPIIIDCEGSGCPPIGRYQPMCPVCGSLPGVDSKTNLIVRHSRDDIIARIKRGDFG